MLRPGFYTLAVPIALWDYYDYDDDDDSNNNNLYTTMFTNTAGKTEVMNKKTKLIDKANFSI
jgi:hypothetical protein